MPNPDTDALRFLWRKGTEKETEDCVMRAHIFGKTESPCAANWPFEQTPPEDDYQLILSRLISIWTIFCIP